MWCEFDRANVDVVFANAIAIAGATAMVTPTAAFSLEIACY